MLPFEELGLEDLLKSFDAFDVLLLADTVTQKRISVSNKDEAVKAIIACSSSAEEIFGRQKITKKCIVNYLVAKNINFSAKWNKNELCAKVLEYWKHQYQMTCAQGSSTPASPEQSRHVNPPEAGAPHQVVYQTSPGPVTHIVNNYSTVYNQVIISPGTEKSTTGGGESTSVITNPHLQQLGETFTKWFYERWNAENPSVSYAVNDFGTHHFWDDASLLSLCLTPERIEDQCTGSAAVSEKLLSFVRDQQLMFNPNLTAEGIKVKSDPHGLVIILVCGTVHQSNRFVGIFDQMFGLIKDPAMNDNWRIKVMKLKISVTSAFSMPKLSDKSYEEIQDLERV
ncbi:hypothetical protein FSP39_000479 [Pinctada imbricata]|uniref:NTF2 domain-containing protein n=1 Tax=Pinctada imbricata TaxID=66713 RepID=A0AA89BVZ5_PINIB|nr:hypothetical protein FSP39_000479 [Pinctada imbricata]